MLQHTTRQRYLHIYTHIKFHSFSSQYRMRCEYTCIYMWILFEGSYYSLTNNPCGVYSRVATIRSVVFIRGNMVDPRVLWDMGVSDFTTSRTIKAPRSDDHTVSQNNGHSVDQSHFYVPLPKRMAKPTYCKRLISCACPNNSAPTTSRINNNNLKCIVTKL